MRDYAGAVRRPQPTMPYLKTTVSKRIAIGKYVFIEQVISEGARISQRGFISGRNFLLNIA